MEDRRKHIDDLFREGLSDYRETPPADVWTALENRLPEPEDDGSSRKWIWLLLLLLMGTAGYLAYWKSSDTKQGINGQTNVSDKIQTTDGNTGLSETMTEASEVDNADAEDEAPELKDTPDSAPYRNGNGSSETHNSTITNQSDDRRQRLQPSSGNVDRNGSSVFKNNRNRVNNTPEIRKGGNKGNKTSDGYTAAPDAGKQRSNDDPGGKNPGRRTNRTVVPASGAKSTTGNRITDRSSVTQDNITSGNKPNIAAPDVSKNNSSASTTAQSASSRKTANVVSQNSLKDDNSYLRQPISLDDEEYMDEENETAKTDRIVNASSPEDEVKKKLLYIPPDESLVPIAPSKVEPNSKPGAANNTDNNAKGGGRSDMTLTSDETGKPQLEVTGSADHKKNLTVEPAVFTDKNLKPEKPARFKKGSGMSVQSDVPTDPDEQINFKPQAALASLTNNTEPGLTIANNSVVAEEENTNPPAGGSGGGGGGTTSPTKNGSRFRFDLGIKAGYERGFENFTTNTFIVAPYLQWNISTGFAFVFQPGFRYNQLSSNGISGASSSYHRINSETVTPNHVVDTSQMSPPLIQRNYIYNSSYDSIVIRTHLKANNYWEIELPVMLRYKIASNLAVFGGLSLMFGNIISTEEVRTTYSGMHKTATLSFPADTLQQDPPIPSPSGYFSYNTPDISMAPAPAEAASSNPARLGLMLGFSYELQNRITIDLMYKQTVSDMKYIQNEQIRKVYTQPNVRVMVGFKLFGSGKENDVKKPEGF